ncbi:MAG: hypothetical protein K9M49_10100 [Candidatus Marinimicrobia bacterium]|nr:hypothetical protein [Candidatus Neomarinimicrobiota bacterium]MCF7851450.1 hypothetical protein [Candidatus Neomarinimicrobiota bacterium]MCF7905486.1 hypothetical protein [Candidatus Neomarinimicrobiota bacterium]
MNFRNIIITVTALAIIAGCDAKENNRTEKVEANTVEISGKVQGGYRALSLAPIGDPLDLTVYRGDYIKLYLDDQGAEKSEYAFEIPDLGISTTVSDTSEEQPYFKMKESGSYPFTLGERSGIMNVIELEQANYTELSSEETWQLMNEAEPPLLLDVRTMGEYYRGYLEGATLIPLQELQMRLDELEKYKNHPVVIYCATGNRSTTASKIMLDRGFKNIMNVRYGIVGWARDGYPIAR